MSHGGITCEIDGRGGARPGFEATHRTIRQHTKRRRCGGRQRDLPLCPWAVARPVRASRRRTEPHVSRPGAAGVEGAGGSGGHGRASRSTTPSRRLACGDLAGGRARRRPEHQRCHNETRPRPVSRPRPRHAHAAPFTTAPPAIRRSCPRDPQPRRGQPRGGRRGRGTGSRTRSRHPRCGRSGSTAGRHRAHHTRRA